MEGEAKPGVGESSSSSSALVQSPKVEPFSLVCSNFFSLSGFLRALRCGAFFVVPFFAGEMVVELAAFDLLALDVVIGWF